MQEEYSSLIVILNAQASKSILAFDSDFEKWKYSIE